MVYSEKIVINLFGRFGAAFMKFQTVFQTPVVIKTTGFFFFKKLNHFTD